jgi:hypothetical protein
MNFIGKWRLREAGSLAVVSTNHNNNSYNGTIYTTAGTVVNGYWDDKGNCENGKQWDLMERFTGENNEERFQEALKKLRSGK